MCELTVDQCAIEAYWQSWRKIFLMFLKLLQNYAFPSDFTSVYEQLDETLKGISLTLSDLVFNRFDKDTPSR